MNKYLITVGTNWCGMDNTYALTTDKELYEIEIFANTLAYENFESFGCEEYVLEDEFPDKEYGELTPEELEHLSMIYDEYFYYTIEEVITDEELEDFKDYEQLTL